MHAVGHRPHTALTCLPGTSMHPHRTDDRGSVKHLWATTGVSTPGKSTGHANCPCGGSLSPRVACVWPRLRLLRGSAFQKYRGEPFTPTCHLALSCSLHQPSPRHYGLHWHKRSPRRSVKSPVASSSSTARPAPCLPGSSVRPSALPYLACLASKFAGALRCALLVVMRAPAPAISYQLSGPIAHRPL
jgi:hypothetical protein